MNIPTNHPKSSVPPPSLSIGAHHDHDKEFNEIGKNISTFRTNSSLFSNKPPLPKQSMPSMTDDDEEGRCF